MSMSMGKIIPYIMEIKNHVWNHQPLKKKLLYTPIYPLVTCYIAAIKPWPSRNSGLTQLKNAGSFMIFPYKSPFSHGFPMVFPWFSHGFPMAFPSRLSLLSRESSHVKGHRVVFFVVDGGYQFIWANYNNSLTWILRPFGDDSPNPNYDFQGSLVVSSL